MYPFAQSVNPAVSSHIDAQLAFFNKLSLTMSQSFQQVVQLNMQLSQALFEEAATMGQRLLTAQRPMDAMSLAASCAQPANDKLRAYQQQLSRLAAGAQVDLTRVTQEHVQDTSRTARVLADEVARATADETDKSLRQQEEALKNFRDPYQQEGNLQRSGDEANADADASVKAAGQGGKVSAQGNMQGNPAQQAGNKSPGHTR